ncbi:MAG: choice-of-anchor Q domain-containing protein [Pyrinomonadaceae bacterium]
MKLSKTNKNVRRKEMSTRFLIFTMVLAFVGLSVLIPNNISAQVTRNGQKFVTSDENAKTISVPGKYVRLEGVVPLKQTAANGLIPSAVDSASVYSNVTNNSGFSVANANATDQSGNIITRLIADDLTTTSATLPYDITGFRFSVGNFNGTAVTFRPLVRFYANDGPSGEPGTYLGGVDIDPITLPANSGGILTISPLTTPISVPVNTIWAGVTFDNNGGATGATLAQMNNIAQSLYSPVDRGSSADTSFRTTAAGSFNSNNPVGTQGNFGGSPLANYAWEILSGATFVVTKTRDTDDGTCDADCSLREAIAAANASGTNDTITFDPSLAGGTINLTMGELSIPFNSTALTIMGLGADQLTVSGSNLSRVFFIDTGGNLSISGMKITGGNGTGSISGFNGFGGGILNFGGTLTLTDVTVSGNSATGQDGGGIANLNTFGTLTMTDSTVSGNSTTGFGGGIANSGDSLTMVNSTISGNASANNGGGIYNGSTLNMTNSTVSNNSGNNGGGIYNQFATTNIRNSIIANSTSGGDCVGSSSTINSEFSLIEDGLTCVNGTNSNNLTGDPNLTQLGNYGGTTQTHALGALSIAIDAGSNALVPGSVTTDQRGFSRIVDGDNDTTATVDMGSVEKTTSENIFVVTKTADTNDASCDLADCSLREAIAAANAAVTDDIVSFNSSLAGQTITLTMGELSIADNTNGALSIIGPGADQLTISGNNSSRIFILSDGVPDGANLTIRGLTLSNGNAGSGADGGAIRLGLNSRLILTDSAITNSTARQGGGIHNSAASKELTITGSTFSGNSSTLGGGGIYIGDDITNITNTTISGNTAGTNGGGIYFNEPGSTTTIASTTISNNSATGSGGGLYVDGDINGSILNLQNTIIADSTSGGDCVNVSNPDSIVFNAEYSLIEDGLTCVTGTNSNNLTGDPNLAPLGDYGGTTQTHAILLPSPAVDTGNSFGSTTDQRGFTRPVDLLAPNAGDDSDIGAYETQFPVQDVGIEGDVAPRFSGDGTVDSADIVQLRLFQIDFSSPDNPEANEIQRLDTAPANTKGDGCIDSADIVQARLYQINFSPLTTAGGPNSQSCGTGLASSSKKGGESKSSQLGPGRVIGIEDAMGSPGNPVQVNVRVDALGDESEYGFTVNFDPNVLTYNSTANGDVSAGATVCNQSVAGVLQCSVGSFPDAGGGSTPIGEVAGGANQILARLNFTVSNSVFGGTTTNLTTSGVNASDDLAQSLGISGQNGVLTVVGPTAASVTISGRVLVSAGGRGVPNAVVHLTNQAGNTRITRTNPFGNYQFKDVAIGETYILGVSSKGYSFTPQAFEITEERKDLDLVANP